jgi:phage major head subunit gpT-like protein
MPTNVVTPAVLNGIDKSFRTDFNTGRGMAARLYQAIAMTIPSSAKENVYGWLADLPSIGRVAGVASTTIGITGMIIRWRQKFTPTDEA